MRYAVCGMRMRAYAELRIRDRFHRRSEDQEPEFDDSMAPELLVSCVTLPYRRTRGRHHRIPDAASRIPPPALSERQLHRQLHLARIADALRKPSKLNSAGVVSGLTLLALLNVLNISRLGMISVAAADAERPLQAPVEREVRVVLSIPVAAAVDAVQHARRRRDRLRRPALHAGR